MRIVGGQLLEPEPGDTDGVRLEAENRARDFVDMNDRGRWIEHDQPVLDAADDRFDLGAFEIELEQARFVLARRPAHQQESGEASNDQTGDGCECDWQVAMRVFEEPEAPRVVF